jgi:hypothetical protein
MNCRRAHCVCHCVEFQPEVFLCLTYILGPLLQIGGQAVVEEVEQAMMLLHPGGEAVCR